MDAAAQQDGPPPAPRHTLRLAAHSRRVCTQTFFHDNIVVKSSTLFQVLVFLSVRCLDALTENIESDGCMRGVTDPVDSGAEVVPGRGEVGPGDGVAVTAAPRVSARRLPDRLVPGQAGRRYAGRVTPQAAQTT